MPKRMLKELEFRRKLFHIGIGLLILGLIYWDILKLWMLLLVLIFGFILSLLNKRYKMPFFRQMLRLFDREEKIPGKGALTFILGIILVWAIFINHMDIVYASVIILTLGDALSSMFSRYFGRTKHPFSDYKFLEGTIAGIIASSLGAMLFVSVIEAVIASVIALIIEAIGVKIGEEFIDDNITIPLSAGAVIFVIQILA